MLGDTTPDDLLEAINSCKEAINFCPLVNLSMDGPNVDWATYNKLQTQWKNAYNNQQFNIGSYGLHQLHNALHKGMDITEWDLPLVLISV